MTQTQEVERLADYVARVVWSKILSMAMERYAIGTADEDDTKDRWIEFRTLLGHKLAVRAAEWFKQEEGK